MVDKYNDIERNLAGLEEAIKRGTITIKEGHLVQGINPEGVEMEIPMTYGQILERKKNIASLKRVLKTGRSSRKIYEIKSSD